MKKRLMAVAVATLAGLFMGCGNPAAEKAEALAVNTFLEADWPQVVKDAKTWVAEDSENPVPHAILNLAYTRLEDHYGVKDELQLAYGSIGKVKKVLNWSSALCEAQPKNPRPYLMKALALEILENNQEAIVCYRKAISIDPKFPQSYTSLGNLYMSLRKTQEALEVFNELLANNPNEFGAYVSIGTVYIIRNDVQKATEYFEKAVQLEPTGLTGLYNLASVYLQTNQQERAVRILLKIVQLDPNGDVGSDARKKLKRMGVL